MFPFPNIWNPENNCSHHEDLNPHSSHLCVCVSNKVVFQMSSKLIGKSIQFLGTLEVKSSKIKYNKKTAPPNLSINIYIYNMYAWISTWITFIYPILMTPHYSPGKRKTLCQKKVSNDSARQESQLLPTNQIITSNLMSPFFLEKKTTPHTSSSMVNYIGGGWTNSFARYLWN